MGPALKKVENLLHKSEQYLLLSGSSLLITVYRISNHVIE